MSSKRKILVSMLVVAFVLLSIIATVAIVFALTQQTIKTSLNIGYTVEDIDGTASATFTIGGVTENLTAMKGENVIGDTLVFKAGDTENAGNLMFPEDALALTAQNDNVVIQYTYSNTGEKHYIASMDFDANIEADNMKVEYSIDGVTYSEDRYAVVVPANTSNKSYWIKISIEDKAKSASFTGDFNWLLNGCDPQDKEYLSLTSLEFTGSNGSYSASVATAGEYGAIVFPSSINGDEVTTIAESSMSDTEKATIKSVYIPDSVTTIGDYAFENYTNLETVTFEQNESVSVASAQASTGLTTIATYAFRGCESLKNFIIPATVISIGNYSFRDCTGLTSIEIPNSVTSIGNYSFQNCTGLTSVTIGSGVTSIASGAFSGCTGLTSVVIPNSVTSIGSSAFSGCTGLTSVTIGSGVTSIGGDAFYGCKGLRSIEVSTENTKYHSAGNCLIETASKSLILGNNASVIPTDGSVTSITSNAFRDCTSLTSIEIPNSVTSIGNYSFQNCTGLTSIEIPNSVTSIGNRAFYGCTGLTSIEIPDSVTSLGYEVFKNCSNLTNAKLGGGITALITDCFNDCSNLKNLSIPDSLNMIDKFVGGITTGTDDALLFNKLTNLTYNVYNNCSYLGNDINPYVLLVKCNDKSISSVTIHPNTKIIGNRAFYNCDSLIEIVIPDNVKMLGYSCFSSCDKLTTVTISASLETIMCRAFSSCKALTSVTFNDVDTWYVKSGTTVDLLDVSVNATYLTSTYKNNNWRKDSQTGCGSVSIYSPFV